jgi:hypothetical protein
LPVCLLDQLGQHGGGNEQSKRAHGHADDAPGADAEHGGAEHDRADNGPWNPHGASIGGSGETG